jgi:hypothetical protein
MEFKITAIIHQGTSIIKITEQIEAKDTDEALFLLKARHAENLVEVISLDTHTTPEETRTDENFVRSPPHHTSGLDESIPNSERPAPFSLG